MIEPTSCHETDESGAALPDTATRDKDTLRHERAANERLREQASDLREANAHLARARDHVEDELERLRADNLALSAQTVALARQRDMVLASASWRVTAPMRRAIEQLSPRHRLVIKQGARMLLLPLRQWRDLRERVAAKRRHLAPGVEQPAVDDRPDDVAATAAGERAPSPATNRRDAPTISFLVRGDRAGGGLAETLGSLRDQAGDGWEAIIFGHDSPPAPAGTAEDPVAPQVRFLPDTETPSGLSCALAAATGEFVAVLDAGDRLTPDALPELTAAVARAPASDVIYSDEAGMDAGTLPRLKPEWSPDLLYAFNYFGRLTLLRRTLVVAAGGVDETCGAAIEWDLNLRVSDLAQVITRLPKILCRRADPAVDRPRAETPQACDARGVIARYWRRHGFDAEAATCPDGTQSVSWPLMPEPRVSVIVPTKDKPDLMRKTAEGLLNDTAYRNLELILVDTGSREDETRSLYETLRIDPRVRILNYTPPFNYSAACNVGAAAASGSILLFLNNDIEVVSADWLAQMVRFAQRPGVGCVGTRLLYPDGRLQHGGVVVGPHLAALTYGGTESEGFGIFGSAHHPRNWMAIMGACQMVTREAFDSVGGFDEAYRIAMGDVGLCLKLWQASYRTAYVPGATLLHHEGATRGHTNPIEDLRHLADDIRSIGIDEDPFLHPELDGGSPTPRLRTAEQESPGAALRRHIGDLSTLHAPVPTFDPFDYDQVQALLGDDLRRATWAPQPSHKIDDPAGAARWTIDLLRRRPELRARYHDALSGGASGAFASWLGTHEADRIQLPPRAREALGALFRADFGARARRYLLSRSDIMGRWPLGLTPINRRELFNWFLRHGTAEGALSPEEVWWLFLEAAERPSQELLQAYLLRPAWQQMFPDAASPFGADRFARWVGAVHNVRDGWLDPAGWTFPGDPAEQVRVAWYGRESWRQRFPLALCDGQQARAFVDWLLSDEAALEPWSALWLAGLDRTALASDLVRPGLTILGHFRYPSGLRVSAETLANGILDQGGTVSLRDVPVGARDDMGRERFLGLESHDITLVHVQPEPFFEDAFERAGVAERQPRPYRIACWYWEFDTVPDSWNRQAILVDEVWTATSFVADALRARLNVPVRTLLPGIGLPDFTRRDRAHFGLAEDETLFLFVFHMMSVMERKNPLGLIRAFRQAFTPDEPVRLVLKVSFGDQHREELDRLRDAATGARITIIDEIYALNDVYALMDACNAYVSLHRSEGLGLTMAEAMMLGKPVIATGYSGNMDFMSSDNSLLVDYELQPLGQPIPPYDADFHWADPNESHAAELMRRVYEDPGFARQLGEKARVHAQERLSVSAAGRRVVERLGQIRAGQAVNGSAS